MRRIRLQTGFSLVELAIVLFILSLLLGTLLPTFSVRVELEERGQTQGQLEEIREVIYGHVLRNSYLPCPDCRDNNAPCPGAGNTANDGLEDTITGAGTSQVCASEVGNLPWVTLGVKGTDAWEREFTYRVDDVFADRDDPINSDGAATPLSCTAVTLNVSFSLCSDGDITILDSDGGVNVATNLPAVIISHGKNGGEAPSVHEQENYDDGSAGDTNKTFVDKPPDSPVAGTFDDMLIWISPYMLRNRMLNAGILP